MKKKDVKTQDVKTQVLDFVKGAIEAQKRKGFKGAHVVYSGLNDAIRKVFNVDPRLMLNELQEDGKLVIKTAKGGAIAYLPGDASIEPSKAEALIAEVLGKKKAA